jgi:sulfofructose kinase
MREPDRLDACPAPISRLVSPEADFVGLGINSLDTIIRLPHYPEFNSKISILAATKLPGGQTATAAVACQRWGLRSRYIGKIGDDDAGRTQRLEFLREGVEAHLIEVPGCPSQLAFILVDESSGERTILWQRDARLDLTPGEIPRAWIATTRLLHVDGHPCAPATAAAQWAHEAGAIVTADIDNLYDGVELLLEHVDYVIGAREFPYRLTGIADFFEALAEIRRRFNSHVVGCTLGCDGVLIWDGSAFRYAPSFRVSAIDTTGAGDVFHAGFCYSLLRGWTLDYCLDFGCAAAALNCMHSGARGGIRSVDEIARLVSEAPRYAPAFTMSELTQRTAAAKLKIAKTL